VPDLSKITKAKKIKKMVLMHVWLSGIKALLGTNPIFSQGLLLRDKVTIFTSSREVLCYLKMVFLTFSFLKQCIFHGHIY
jgi:hypothetical protein